MDRSVDHHQRGIRSSGSLYFCRVAIARCDGVLSNVWPYLLLFLQLPLGVFLRLRHLQHALIPLLRDRHAAAALQRRQPRLARRVVVPGKIALAIMGGRLTQEARI